MLWSSRRKELLWSQRWKELWKPPIKEREKSLGDKTYFAKKKHYCHRSFLDSNVFFVFVSSAKGVVRWADAGGDGDFGKTEMGSFPHSARFRLRVPPDSVFVFRLIPSSCSAQARQGFHLCSMRRFPIASHNPVWGCTSSPTMSRHPVGYESPTEIWHRTWASVFSTEMYPLTGICHPSTSASMGTVLSIRPMRVAEAWLTLLCRNA